MSSPNQLSFLPEDYLDTKRQRRTNFICAALFLVLMGAIGTTFTFVERSLRNVEREHAEVDKQFAEAAKRIEQVKQMQDKQRKMAQQAELTASLLEKVPRSFLLAELTNAMPAGISLLNLQLSSSLRQQQNSAGAGAGATQFQMKKAAMEAASGGGGGSKMPVAPAPQAKQYDVKLLVEGMADTDMQVAQYMARLNRSKLLQDVNLVISDEYQYLDKKVRKFKMEIMVNPNAEIAPGTVQPKTATTAVEVK
jgi:Tfp pilus assembly protein PilN